MTMMRRLPKRGRRRGLSLIEVLLAMTIFIMSIVAIGRLVDIGTERELEARFHTQGARLAEAKLAEIEAGAVSFTESGGSFPNDPDWSWSMTAELQSVPNLYLVTVTVSRDLKGRLFEVSVAQMMLDPQAWGAAGEATRPDGGGSQP
jgi:Tfp pilus assembly protein PilV